MSRTGFTGVLTPAVLLAAFLALTSPAWGAASFGGDKNLKVGDGPYSVASADLDADGRLDLVVPNTFSDNVSVLMGSGGGSFDAASNHLAGDGPRTVAIGDFGGDGKPDLAVSNVNSGNVSVLAGRGDGTFAAPANYAVGGRPRTVAGADFDADSDLDLVVVNRTANNVSVLLGKGDGTFAPAVNYAAGSYTFDVTVGDFDGDARPDLAVANRESDNVSILLGNGDGTFRKTSAYGVGDAPYSLTNADFDRDGKLDLVVGNLKSRDVAVLLGRGDGTFGAPARYAAGTYGFSVASVDFDADGKLDLAVSNAELGIVNAYTSPGSVAILPGNGSGGFGKPVNYGAGSGPVAAKPADFDGDDKPDLAVANINSDDVSVLLQGNTNLTLAASPPLLSYGQPATLTGRLTRPDGAPLGGRRVILEQRPTVRSAFVAVAGQPAGGVTTLSDGTFRLTGAKTAWSADYRARFADGSTAAVRPATSPLARVEMKMLVGLNLDSSPLKLGMSRTISGSITPAHTGYAKLTIKRNGAVVSTRDVPLGDSRYKFVYKPPTVGTYSISVSFPDHPPGHLGNTSPTKSFNVVR